MSTTTSLPVTIEPPVNHPAVGDDGLQTKPWLDHAQDIADRLTALTQQVGLIAGTGLTGVTDGSDAAAGHVGEYLSAFGSGGLTNATPADRATLTLTAGDWDVAGSATITPNLPNMTYAQAWLGTAANTQADPGRQSIQSGGAGTLGIANLSVGPVRFSVTASTAVHLGCQANFPGGTTVTAGAFIRARRMR